VWSVEKENATATAIALLAYTPEGSRRACTSMGGTRGISDIRPSGLRNAWQPKDGSRAKRIACGRSWNISVRRLPELVLSSRRPDWRGCRRIELGSKREKGCWLPALVGAQVKPTAAHMSQTQPDATRTDARARTQSRTQLDAAKPGQSQARRSTSRRPRSSSSGCFQINPGQAYPPQPSKVAALSQLRHAASQTAPHSRMSSGKMQVR